MCFANVGLSISPECVLSSEKLLRRLVYLRIYQYSLVFLFKDLPFWFIFVVTKQSIVHVRLKSLLKSQNQVRVNVNQTMQMILCSFD